MLLQQELKQWQTVAEREVAEFAFADNLGRFKSNSDLTHFADRFNVKVSASTITKNAQGEHILQYLATHDGTGTSTPEELIQTNEPLKTTVIEPATIIELPQPKPESVPTSWTDRLPI